jgi:hypothetical protein
MNPQVKEKWLTALRSGEYKQTDGALRDSKGFCCLGVLCDVYTKENNKEWECVVFSDEATGHYWKFDGSMETLPQTVIDWAELDDNCPEVRYVIDPNYTIDDKYLIADLNDRGINFKVLADLIEEQL